LKNNKLQSENVIHRHPKRNGFGKDDIHRHTVVQNNATVYTFTLRLHIISASRQKSAIGHSKQSMQSKCNNSLRSSKQRPIHTGGLRML